MKRQGAAMKFTRRWLLGIAAAAIAQVRKPKTVTIDPTDPPLVALLKMLPPDRPAPTIIWSEEDWVERFPRKRT